MYVAITRARERLYLTRAQSRMLHGQVRYGLRSRFIEEIPPNLCRWLSSNTLGRADWTPPHQRSIPSSAAAVGATFQAASTSWAGAAGEAATFGSAQSSGPESRSRGVPAFPFRIGQAVQHEKFGSGVVLQCEGGGNDARVQVNFRDAGTKWLALGYARLVSL